MRDRIEHSGPPAAPPARLRGVDIGRVLGALADPTRRQVLQRLGRAPATASALARELPISRQGIGRHLGVLRDAGLVEADRAGREVRWGVRAEPLVTTASWLSTLAATWPERPAAPRERAEGPPD